MIIVVDDDREYDVQLKEILELDGYADVVVTPTGRQALEQLAKTPQPSAMVLDMMIPFDSQDVSGAMPPEANQEARGVTVLRKAVAAGLDVSRVIVITALSTEADLMPVKKMGVHAVHMKPVPVAVLLRDLRQIQRR